MLFLVFKREWPPDKAVCSTPHQPPSVLCYLLQSYYQNRPVVPTNAPRVQTSSGPRPVGATHVYPSSSQMMVIPQQQLSFTGSPQGYFIPTGQVRLKSKLNWTTFRIFWMFVVLFPLSRLVVPTVKTNKNSVIFLYSAWCFCCMMSLLGNKNYRFIKGLSNAVGVWITVCLNLMV